MLNPRRADHINALPHQELHPSLNVPVRTGPSHHERSLAGNFSIPYRPLADRRLANGLSGSECGLSIIANVDASDHAMLYQSLSPDEFVARLLVDIWTLATGRTLRCDVPPHELTAEELIDFWADDHLDTAAAMEVNAPVTAAVRHRGVARSRERSADAPRAV
jgi:hypothetical protein